MSTSSNESFVVISSDFGYGDGDPVKRILKPVVTFDNVLDEYPLGLDLLVQVTFDKSHRPSALDSIVLVPVGWHSIEDALAHGERFNDNVVKFSLETLPEDDQLCQFCYYAGANSSVLGVSTIFKFERYSKERLIEFVRCPDFADLLARAIVSGEAYEQLLPASLGGPKSSGEDWSRVRKFLAKMEEQRGEQRGEPDEMKQSASVTTELAQSVNELATEMVSTLTKEWAVEKKYLVKEMKEMKITVAELKEKMDQNHDCSTSDTDSVPSLLDEPRIIYGITATHRRPQQFALLTRLSHTLRLVPHFHWILVEDARSQSAELYELLRTSGISFTYILAESPISEKDNADHREFVVQRNAALRWLRDRRETFAVAYFMDEAKIYSLDIFEEMRYIRTVGVWPVGLAGGLPAEKPVLNADGRVVGWNSKWRPDRQFPMDAIGFAINLGHLNDHPKAKFELAVEPALRLSHFLSLLTTVANLEPKADRCTKVLVWYSSA